MDVCVHSKDVGRGQDFFFLSFSKDPPSPIFAFSHEKFFWFYRVHTYRAATISVVMDYFMKLYQQQLLSFSLSNVRFCCFSLSNERVSYKSVAFGLMVGQNKQTEDSTVVSEKL